MIRYLALLAWALSLVFAAIVVIGGHANVTTVVLASVTAFAAGLVVGRRV